MAQIMKQGQSSAYTSRESNAGAVWRRWRPETQIGEEQSGGTGDGAHTRVVEEMEEWRRLEWGHSPAAHRSSSGRRGIQTKHGEGWD